LPNHMIGNVELLFFWENRAWEGIGAWRAASWLSGRVR
jgi:hypothetical protein